MSISQHLKTALQSIKSEKERAVMADKERVTREVIIPHNTEVDTAASEAIAEVTAAYNRDLALLQEQFNQRKQSIHNEAQRKKDEFAKNAIAASESVIVSSYDKEISAIENQISRIGDNS